MPMNIQSQRIQNLPVRGDEIWQGGVVRLPAQTHGIGSGHTDPAICFWASDQTGQAHITPPTSAQAMGVVAAVAALVDFATDTRKAGYLPGRIETVDPAIAAGLRPLLEGLNVEVIQVPNLEIIDELTAGLAESLGNPQPLRPLTR